MGATMKDLAKETGLGLATISSYFNGGNVREKNRVKIEKAIKNLHYEVNEVARSFKTNTTRTIGVVIPELNNTFCAQIITELEDVLRSHGYATIVCDCRTDETLEKEAAEFLQRRRVDGIISMPVSTNSRHLDSFSRTGKPIVLIDRMIQGLPCDCVLTDNRRAAHDAVRLLTGHGHKRIGLVGGPGSVYTALERLQGYLDALKEAGIQPDERLIYNGDYTIRGGSEGVRRLMQDNPDMTAVFVTNYEMTMGAVITLNEEGVRIPEQISLIGFDNPEFARACNPSLTIVTQPVREIGQEAAAIMLERLAEEQQTEKKPEERSIRRLKTALVAGRSVADIKYAHEFSSV